LGAKDAFELRPITKAGFFDKSIAKRALKKPVKPAKFRDQSSFKGLPNYNAIGSYSRERSKRFTR
jgi:hypothetical protein